MCMLFKGTFRELSRYQGVSVHLCQIGSSSWMSAASFPGWDERWPPHHQEKRERHEFTRNWIIQGEWRVIYEGANGGA